MKLIYTAPITIALVLLIALFLYPRPLFDSDSARAYRHVMKKYGADAFSVPGTPCKYLTDGIGIHWAPFGRTLTSCNNKYYIGFWGGARTYHPNPLSALPTTSSSLSVQEGDTVTTSTTKETPTTSSQLAAMAELRNISEELTLIGQTASSVQIYPMDKEHFFVVLEWDGSDSWSNNEAVQLWYTSGTKTELIAHKHILACSRFQIEKHGDLFLTKDTTMGCGDGAGIFGGHHETFYNAKGETVLTLDREDAGGTSFAYTLPQQKTNYLQQDFGHQCPSEPPLGAESDSNYPIRIMGLRQNDILTKLPTPIDGHCLYSMLDSFIYYPSINYTFDGKEIIIDFEATTSVQAFINPYTKKIRYVTHEL